MQILGKRSKVLLIIVSIVMLIAIGISFATWDSSVVKATNGDLSTYANAKVGDVITFGEYYQTGEKDPDDPTEYKKTPIEWLVVDKDERTGQLTLLSKKILASGSYFGNWYYNLAGTGGSYYDNNETVASVPYNQAYVDSTARAFLNNLERRDMGADSYSTADGYKTGVANSTKDGYDPATPSKFVKGTGLLSSAGFSNRKYNSGYKRPIEKEEYKNRPATRGFYDEAFSHDEKAMIVPKAIAGYTGFRWPNNSHNPKEMSYVEGAVDKVWLPSAAELNNVENGDEYTNPSDAAGSTVFEYFKNYNQYKNPVTNTTNTSLANALKAERTELAKNSFAMNYSIPLYLRNSTTVNTDIHATNNSIDYYWTRSPGSYSYSSVRYVHSSGSFDYWHTDGSSIGVRPALILSY